MMCSGMGSPAAANALEMASANGASRVVVFGACGGVDERVGVGDLVVATGAVRGEGTSEYYAPPEFPAAFDLELSARLWRGACDGYDGTCHRGVVYTTDAGYRQGPEVYERYAGLIVGVESECAAVAVVGARLGIEVAALLFEAVAQLVERDVDDVVAVGQRQRLDLGRGAHIERLVGTQVDVRLDHWCQAVEVVLGGDLVEWRALGIPDVESARPAIAPRRCAATG